MRKLLLIVGLALLIAGGAFGLTATVLRLAWDEAPPTPKADGASAGHSPGIARAVTAPGPKWEPCRSPPTRCTLTRPYQATRLPKGEGHEKTK